MTDRRRRHRRALLLAGPAAAASLAVGATPRAGLAQAGAAWPNRPIRLVIPFPPAGTTDIVGRMTAERLSQRLGHQVVVENRAGAGGNIGAEAVAKAEPDGHTLLLTTIGTGAINYAVYGARMPYKPEDLVAVGLMTRVPNVMMVSNRVGARSVAELVALAKARPGKLNYGSTGFGSSPHVGMELFKILTGTDLFHVPYRGSAPMLTELMADRVDTGMDNIPSALGHVRDGRLRAIATTGARRSPVLPEVPTMQEAGVPGFEATAWFGVLAPAHAPQPVIERLGRELDGIGKESEFRARLAGFGAEPPALTPDGGSSPESFAAFLRSEIAKWADVVQRSGARLE